MGRVAPRRGHGWWPYVGPYVAFLGLVEIGARLPEGLAPWLLPLKVAVPALLLLGFAWRGAYPELRGFRLDRGAALDVAVGLGIAALWVGPFLLLPELPRGDEAFDPGRLGPRWREATIALRLTGFALVTPFMEELFVRSFLLRLADVLQAGRGDFRSLPIGRFAWPGFLVTVVWFTFSHLPWEWIVAAPTGVLFNLWLYARRHIGATILAHAVANGAIGLWVVAGPASRWIFL